MIHLKMIEQSLDDPDLVLLKIIKTRWLSLSNVISNLHRILTSVVVALEEDSANNIVMATGLLNAMDRSFLQIFFMIYKV
jgi:hypothetical protein